MRRIQELMDAYNPVVAPGAFDAFTARLIEEHGFPAVYVGGNSLGISMCTPEPLTGLSNLIEQSRHIIGAVDVPVIADANAGFGDVAHVMKTVRDCAAVGLSAIHIEDQPYPKNPGYHRGDYRVTEETEILRKLEVATRAREGSELAIIGRSDMFRVNGSVDSLAARFAKYTECGVDMLFATGIPTERAVEVRQAVAAVSSLPMLWLSGSGAKELTTSDVSEAGYELMVYPTTLWSVASEAVRDLLKHLGREGWSGIDSDYILKTRENIFRSMGLAEYWLLEEEFGS